LRRIASSYLQGKEGVCEGFLNLRPLNCFFKASSQDLAPRNLEILELNYELHDAQHNPSDR